ncbi:hypothetical protein [Streptomyces sp. NRRL S-813]|uniref:hypothetical protein n=1 Tax=Streptomyces sp. NRRL S-813 TaxID=1463919 RepID=UPI001F441267|nr:hypothetical protein [Streptomyces sp. NRRL S-813]
MDLAYDDFALPGDPHASITTYTADPGTPSAEGLTLPAIWADTQKQPRIINDEARRTRPRHPWLFALLGRSPPARRGRPGRHVHGLWLRCDPPPSRRMNPCPLRHAAFSVHRLERSSASEALGPIGAVGG